MKRYIIISCVIFCFQFWIGCNKPPTSGDETPRDVPWKMFNIKNSNLISNRINTITIDRKGAIWIGTDKGANRFLSGRWEIIKKPFEYGIDNNIYHVNTITVGKDGTVWFGLAGGGLRRLFSSYWADSWIEYKTPTLTSDMIFSIAVDNMGEIWVGSAKGVNRFIPHRTNLSEGYWIDYTSRNSLILDDYVRSVGVNPFDNTIWFGTYTQGVISYDGDLDWNMSAPNDKPFPIISMGFTYSNTIWFGTYGDWTYKYNSITTEWVQFGDSTLGGGLPNYFVNVIVTHTNGDVWFGTNIGLTRLRGNTWKTWNKENSEIPSDIVKTLAFDRNGNLWIGTIDGLAVFNEEGIVN
ncbi:MAG: two-component regulator propeller domain-containing protein [Bacteroidota bacterium]|nr:two-component regulator propeller domain-containing protein [Bacteroidota bacterium]